MKADKIVKTKVNNESMYKSVPRPESMHCSCSIAFECSNAKCMNKYLVDIRILVVVLLRDDVGLYPFRWDPYQEHRVEQLNQPNIHLSQFGLAPTAESIQINRYRAKQHAHNDMDSHKPNHISNRTQTNSISRVSIHFYANRANARFVHKSHVEILFGQLPVVKLRKTKHFYLF